MGKDEEGRKGEELGFGGKLSRGAASALLVALPLAMGVTVFDRSVIQFANGTAPSLSRALSKGFQNVLRSPIACALGKDNLAVFAVYGTTYVGKNAAEISADEFNLDKFWTVFFVSTIVNSSMGILKDRFLATMFGKGPATFPLNSYINFIARDSVIVGASFNGPLLVSPWLQRNFSGMSKDSCDVVAQLGCPAAAQIIGTPIHMLGLDFYNRPQASLATRILEAVKSSYAPIGVRMVRQCYVFGFGSLAVKYVNKKFQGEHPPHK